MGLSLVSATGTSAQSAVNKVVTGVQNMWIVYLNPVSANSEKGSGFEWALRVGQRVPSRFGQSRVAREMNLVQIGNTGN